MHNSKPKTLVILTPGFPENENDSTCIPPRQIFVRTLHEVNPQLNIIVLTFVYPFFSKEYNWNGIKVISYGHPKNHKLSRLFTGKRVTSSLKKINQDSQIIGLLSFWLGKCAVIGDRFAKKHNLKHYSWLLGQDAKPGNKYFYKIKPDGGSLIALSDFIAREVEKNYVVLPKHIIPVCIDTALFEKGVVNRDIDILGAGSLILLKQYDVFIKLIGKLKETFPNVKATICGDGAEMQRLSAMIKKMNLSENVLLVGRLSHSQVLSMMQRSKVFLHTSAYEGFGSVCLEALYAGAEVVSFVRPMDQAIPKWHIVADDKSMIEKLTSILLNPKIDHSPVLPYSIQANAKALLQLFNYSE